MWREELLVMLDVDPHDFPIVVIGNKVRRQDIAAAKLPREKNLGWDVGLLSDICERRRAD